MTRVLAALVVVTIASFIVGACDGCTSTPPPVPAPTPIAGATSADACAALKVDGCPEGLDPKCVEVLGRMLDARFVEQKTVGCLAAARSKDEARACKAVRCE